MSFWPGHGESFISTADVNDICNGPDDSVVFATSNGLSVFNDGDWSIYHSKATDRRGYLEGIPLNNYVTCAEYDSSGNLWLGFSDGIQIYDGYSVPVTLKYPQKTLISYSIHDLQSLGDQMWIAAGSSGLYCYQNGEWKWFKPFSANGPDAYRITDMAADYSTGSLVIASEYNGQYILLADSLGNPYFKPIKEPCITEDMTEVRTCHEGGVYFFNSSDISYYNPAEGAVSVLNILSLTGDSDDYIHDISSAYDGKLVIGTNYGLYAWKDGFVTDSFSRKELIDNNIKKVFADINGRFWFTNRLFAGYYYKNEFKPSVSFEII